MVLQGKTRGKKGRENLELHLEKTWIHLGVFMVLKSPL
jgi:hypothetical protein